MWVQRTGTQLAVVASVPDDERLRVLLHRVARADRASYMELHRAISGPLYSYLRGLPTDPAGIASLMSATFYELWLLAGEHDAQDLDVWDWVRTIAQRRVADRDRDSTTGSTDPSSVQAVHDATTSLAVRALITGQSG